MSEKPGTMRSETFIAVRPFERWDVPGASRIDHASFGENAWSERSLLSELEREDTVMFSALVDGELAGFAGMRMVLDEGYVGNIAVAPRHRRQGVGTELVRALISAGRERGLRFITLEARVSNAGAIALYESLGFRDAGLRRGFYSFPKEDARLMTLYLREEGKTHGHSGD